MIRDASSPETVSQTAATEPVALVEQKTPVRAAVMMEVRASSGSSTSGGSRWKRAFFKIIKYPLMILIVNVLLIGYIKRTLSEADLEINFKPAVPPFH